MNMDTIIETKNLTKKFGNFTANDHIDLAVKEGEIRAIIGENGAGKSTLMNMLYGILQPTEGEILFRGKKVAIASPRDAIELGIGMVHQHFKLVECFSLKMLYRDVDLLILDEPTAVLIPQEVDDLIRRLIDLKKAGKTIIIITHKLNEVKMCTDNITVIRAGHVIGTVPNDENTTDEDLAEMMVGRAVLLRVKKSGKPVGGKVAYQVNHLSAVNSEGKKILNDISFRIHENEVVGIAGVEGNGQTELMLALTGLLDVCHGSTVELGGVNITGLWPDELRKHDIGVVPEDRYKQGLCLDVPVSANLIAGYHGLKPYCNKGVMNRRAITENRDRLVEEYDVRLSTKDPAVGSLSGGNAQKVIIAREFSRRPKVLLVSQPTRGVDIGAIEFIHNQILKMRDASTAVLIISSELSEVTGLSDRVLVMYHGEIVGSFRSDDVSFNELGLYMSGVKRMSSEELSEE